MKSEIVRFITNRNIQILFVIIVLGLFVRIWDIDWGFPEIYEEARPMYEAWKFWGWETGKFDLNPHTFGWPSFSFYIAFITQVFFYIFGRIVGTFGSLSDFRHLYNTNTASFVLIHRSVSLLFGLGAVIFTYIVGSRYFGKRVGLLASFFLALNILHIIQSQHVSPDILVTFLVLVSYLYIYNIYKKGRVKDYILGGLFIGLSVATKYIPILLILSLLISHFFRQENKTIKSFINLKITIGILFIVVGFFIGSPFSFLDIGTSLKYALIQKVHMTAVPHFGQEHRITSWLFYLTHSLKRSMGIPLEILSFLGIILLGYTSWRKGLLFLIFPLAFFILIGSWKTAFDHYILPIIPFLLILASYITIYTIERIFHPKVVQPTLILCSIIFISPCFINLLSYHAKTNRPDTRKLTKEWIEENVPQKSLIAGEVYTPLLKLKQYRCVLIPMFSERAELSAPFYDLRLYEDFNYVILSSDIYGRYHRQPEKYKAQIKFYKQLEDKFTLLKRFDEQDGYGPIIIIYKNKKDTRVDESFGDQFMQTLFEKLENYEILHKEQTRVFMSHLGEVLFDAGQKDKSMKIFQKILEINPNDIKAYYNLAVIYLEKQLFNKAIIMCNKVLELNPNDTDAHFMLAVIFESLGPLEKAIHHYIKTIEDRPKFMDAYIRLGIIYAKQKEFSKARDILEQVLSIDPSNKVVAEMLQKLSGENF